MKANWAWRGAAALLSAPALADRNRTNEAPPAVEDSELPRPSSERNEPVAPPPTDRHLEDEAAREPGTGGAGMEDPLDDRDVRHDPSRAQEVPLDEGQGGSGEVPEAPEVEDNNPPVPPPELTPPTDDPSIMGQERDADMGGAVFDTGDISGRQPATIPEGSEPGPGSPMPSSEEIRPSGND